MSISLASLATNLVADLGYWGLSAGLVIDSFGVPLPSEVLIPLAVVGAERGRLALWAVVVLSVGAQVLGATISYLVGRQGGLPAVRRFGRYAYISTAHLDRAERVFARHGGWISAAGRCLPVVRGLIGFPAGAARMPFGQFLVWSTLGSALWTAVLVALGELVNSNLGPIERLFGQVTTGVVVVLAAALGWYLWRARRRAAAATGERSALRPSPDGADPATPGPR